MSDFLRYIPIVFKIIKIGDELSNTGTLLVTHAANAWLIILFIRILPGRKG